MMGRLKHEQEQLFYEFRLEGRSQPYQKRSFKRETIYDDPVGLPELAHIASLSPS